MKVVLDHTPQPTGGASNTPATPATPRVSTASADPNTSAAQESPQETQKHPLPAGTPQTSITFRRDPKGQIYYVVTDAQSGRELRQVPPEELRKVGEGIEEFLQQQQSKATTHVETKA
jgi:hypothetical protein